MSGFEARCTALLEEARAIEAAIAERWPRHRQYDAVQAGRVTIEAHHLEWVATMAVQNLEVGPQLGGDEAGVALEIAASNAAALAVLLQDQDLGIGALAAAIDKLAKEVVADHWAEPASAEVA